eukprot:GHVS01077111.1.p1 GENE.GHVS01077111.1~~GHVS01077111.1.p1  ORF type:complete len:109 (-),score=32.46 GHVS01077111.1:340-666(-)
MECLPAPATSSSRITDCPPPRTTEGGLLTTITFDNISGHVVVGILCRQHIAGWGGVVVVNNRHILLLTGMSVNNMVAEDYVVVVIVVLSTGRSTTAHTRCCRHIVMTK